ncbi:MAG: FAD-binding protein [Ilumatobacteraceae bacterium]
MRTNWSGTVAFEQPLALPTSLDEVRSLVRDHERVLAVGSAHSFSRAAVSSGLHLGTEALPPVVVVAPDRSTVTVAAGMRYAELGRALHAQGLALAAMASLPHISVGGAVATGTHGSGDAIGTLSSAVTALEVVTPDGDVRWVSREDADFAGWVVALGALGVVTRVSLAVEPTYDVAQSVLLGLNLDLVEQRFDDVFAAATSVSVFTRWRPTPDAQLWLKRRVDREGPWPGSPDFGARTSEGKMHPLEDLDPVHCTEQLGQPGSWHERLPHFKAEFTPSSGDEIQAEYLLPRVRAVEGIRAVRALADRITPLLHVTEIRTMRADDLWLSPAYGHDTVGIHFTWHKDERIFDVLPAIEEALLPLGARPHWGKVTLATPEQLAAAYPRMDDFRRLVNDADSQGKCRSVVVDSLMNA